MCKTGVYMAESCLGLARDIQCMFVQHFPALAGSCHLYVYSLVVRTQAVGLWNKAFGAEEVVSASHTFLGFL